MNHKVSYMEGKSSLKKTLVLRLQGAVRRKIVVEHPPESRPGNRSPFPMCLKMLREEKRDRAQPAVYSPESSFHYVYSHCIISSREPLGQREGRQGLRKSECQCVCCKPGSLMGVALGGKYGILAI